MNVKATPIKISDSLLKIVSNWCMMCCIIIQSQSSITSKQLKNDRKNLLDVLRHLKLALGQRVGIFSSLLAIDHRMTSFLWCFPLHAKKNKQSCLEVINYSKYLQYFEGQINKVFSTIRVGLLVVWWVKKSSLKTFTVVCRCFCGQLLRKQSVYLLLWVFNVFLEKSHG